jgi:SpoVK/Ycf46/Vps4 family AAA+-type ATPase
VFEHAEREGWALFFDEADALFGKRSEVNDAHDRYASMGINYLLKRLADYEGALILAASQPVDVDAVLAKEALRHRRWRVVRFPRPRA